MGWKFHLGPAQLWRRSSGANLTAIISIDWFQFGSWAELEWEAKWKWKRRRESKSESESESGGELGQLGWRADDASELLATHQLSWWAHNSLQWNN